MRLPSYLILNRLGMFCLRVVLPPALRERCPSLPREVRRSLGTRDRRAARAYALQFAARYQALLAQYSEPHARSLDALADLPGLVRNIMADAIVGSATLAPTSPSIFFHELREPPSPTSTIAAEWLSGAIERYRDEMRLEERWRDEQTWKSAYEPTLRHFREIIAPEETVAPRRRVHEDGQDLAIFDIQVGGIRDDHVRQFKIAMGKWPKGFGHGARGETRLSAKDALRMVHLPPQSAGNALKKFEVVKAFLRWAHKDGCIPDGDRYARILPSKSRNSDGQGKRGYLPFTRVELRMLFESAEYRENGFQSGAQYWIPLLGLYTGARINELAQLNITDLVTTEEGIRCFQISDAPDEHDGTLADRPAPLIHARKTIKTPAARRLMPIHPMLLSIGFDRYVAEVAASGSRRLFPGLTFEEKSGYGRSPSRHFREYTQRLGLHVPRKKVFHSLRSTLNGALQKNGMPEEWRCRLLGHATKSVNDRHYGGQTPLQIIAQELSRIDFGITHPPYHSPGHPLTAPAT